MSLKEEKKIVNKLDKIYEKLMTSNAAKTVQKPLTLPSFTDTFIPEQRSKQSHSTSSFHTQADAQNPLLPEYTQRPAINTGNGFTYMEL